MKAKEQKVRQDQITLKNLLKLPLYFTRGVKYHAAGRIYTPKPIWATLHVTHRCNARCIMCSDVMCTDSKRWASENELTVAEIGRIFRNPLFDSVEHFSLSGGEPTQREDLVEIAQTVLDSCPRIKNMSISTNGLESDLVVETVQRILTLPNCESLNRLTVSISLDGSGDTHQKIRKFPQAFERATETIKRLQSLESNTPLHLCSTCVVQPLNLSNLVQLQEFAKGLGLPMSFIPVWVSESFVEDTTGNAPLRLTHQHLERLKVLIGHEMQPDLPLSNFISWQEYFKIVSGGKRRLPCFLLHHYVGVDSDGTLYTCYAYCPSGYGNARDELPDKIWYSERAKEIRGRLEKDFCPKCTICCNTALSLQEEFFYAARFLLKEKTRQLLGK